MTSDGGYLRFPTIFGDLVGFVAEDDVWLAPLDGGRAWRLTADHAPVARARFSPDGSRLAFVSSRDGAPEVHVVDVDGGPSRRLTHWGDPHTRVVGWTGDGRVLAVSATGEPFRSHTWAYAVPLDGGPAERLDYGPVTQVATGPNGAVVLGVNQNSRSLASWKRYRGGTAGALWVDPDGSGRFSRLLGHLTSPLEDPSWVGDRLALLSDHEGWANVYSCRVDGSDLRRHTDHGDAYARAATADGHRVVYQVLGELWLLDDLSADSRPRRLDIRLSGPRTARQVRPVHASEHIDDFAADRDGRASAVEVYGTVHWLTSRDGPARALADRPGVRARLPRVLGRPESDSDGDGDGGSEEQPPSVCWVTDAEGDDAVEIAPATGSAPPRRLAAGQLGRVLALAAAPDGSVLAAASHDGRVLLVDVVSGTVRTLDRAEHGDVSGLAFSPDSRWLAWSHPGPEPLRQIRMARVDTATTDSAETDSAEVDGAGAVEVTALRFVDTDPVFTHDGKHLAFLSARTFDPVYDEHVFDLSFPAATRPYLVPLAAATPSPFDPAPDGRPTQELDGTGGDRPASAEDRQGDGADKSADGESTTPETVVDVAGLPYRVVPVPVATGRCRALLAAKDGLLWLDEQPTGVLGDSRAGPEDERQRPRLRRYDLKKRRLVTLAERVDGVALTGDGRRVLLRDGSALRLVPADRPVDPDDDDASSPAVEVDLRRVRVQVDPTAQWRQMYDEAGRLMRDHYWVADMAGVDWSGVLDRYRPVVDRIGSRDDLSELLWEVQGELGSSHAYEMPPYASPDEARQVGFLGADLAREDDGRWRVARIVPGESSAPAARSPLVAPGVDVNAGDVLVAVDGRPVDPATGPGPLLAGAAGVPVELAVQPADGGEQRRVVVVPLADERPLRYHAWVADRRAAVHAATDGRVGYLHIPDMMGNGWAQLHRDLRVEVAREALIVDVRDNGGGHVSELVLEKLARTVRGWTLTRHAPPSTYPVHAPRGPLVAVCNEWAGSDGDIVTAGFQLHGLGPVVGTRTWGGVIGIDMRYGLVDGTVVTQPRYSFHFDRLGWGVENYGVDPDVEVPIAPQDWADGRDPQLDTAVRLALTALAERPAASPPDPSSRPSRQPPTLPPR